MFAINDLLSHQDLAPLKKLYEQNESDPRLVVVAEGEGANILETIAMHKWLGSTGYQHIPTSWESDDLFTFDVVHISKLTIKIVRRNPFSSALAPLAPNSWLNRLEQKRFDALLLAQATGDIPMMPTTMQIKDQIKPAIEAGDLSDFWEEMVDAVLAAQSGVAPRNTDQKRLFSLWEIAQHRRFYDPTDLETVPFPAIRVENRQGGQPNVQPIRTYNWGMTREERSFKRREFHRHIAAQLKDVNGDAGRAAQWVFGTTSTVKLNDSALNVAFDLMQEAERRGDLDKLASYFDFVMPSFQGQGDVIITNVAAGSGGVAIGKGVSQTIIMTGNGNVIQGDVDVRGGDFIGGSRSR